MSSNLPQHKQTKHTYFLGKGVRKSSSVSASCEHDADEGGVLAAPAPGRALTPLVEAPDTSAF